VCSGGPGFDARSTSSSPFGVTDPTYTDTSVVCGTTYCYGVSVSNIYGDGPPSNIVTAAAPCVPGTGPSPGLSACRGDTDNAAFVCAAYEYILARAPDPAGLSYWEAAISSGESRSDVVAGMTSSSEYRSDLASAYFEHFLGRAADAGGLSYWVGRLEAGATNEQVIAGIVGSPEFYADAQSA
jgi:Domain of unknown function (DUF4214)